MKPPVRYAVPALERGLDIIELLAHHDGGLSLSEIARALDLTVSAIFRSVVVLEARGYVARAVPDDTYVLSLRLFELSQIRPPLRRLMDVAVPAMRVLAQTCGQPAHLSVHDNGALLVIADVEGPGPLNLSFRPGGRWPMRDTVSGRVLLAHQPRAIRDAWIDLLPPAPHALDFLALLDRIAERGHDRAASEAFSGIVDLGVPIRARHGALAALTVSMMTGLNAKAGESEVLAALNATADEISAKLGGIEPSAALTGENANVDDGLEPKDQSGPGQHHRRQHHRNDH